MAIKTKEELKSYFETGDKPTQQNYEDLLDTLFDTSGSAVQKVDEIIIDLSQKTNTIDETFTITDIISAPGENKMIVVDTIKTFVKPVEGYTIDDAFGMSLVCDFTNHETSSYGLATILYGFDLKDNGILVNKRNATPNNNYDVAIDSKIINSGLQIRYASDRIDNPPKAIDGKCKVTVIVAYTIIDVS